MQLEISRYVFAGDRIVMRVHHQLIERAPRKRIYPFMGRHRAILQQHIIAVLFEQSRNKVVDETCIDERRIRGHTDDHVGVEHLCGSCKARKHIVFRPADHDHVVLPAPVHDRIVARMGRCRDGDLLDELRAFQAVHDVPQ